MVWYSRLFQNFPVYCDPHSQRLWHSQARLNESQTGIKIARRNINNLRHANDTTLMAESEEELKSLLMVKEESGKHWFKSHMLCSPEEKKEVIWMCSVTSVVSKSV